VKPELKRLKDKPPTLEEAQAFVGGYVELIRVGKGQLLVNEEGRLRKLEHNVEASDLAGQFIVGNALFLTGKARWS